MMRLNKLIISVIAGASILALSACGSKAEEPVVKNQGDPITVGSFVDTEGGILGNIILLALEDKGYLIEDKVQFGTPDIHRNALLQAELDIGVDYTGNGQYYVEGFAESVWVKADTAYESIRTADEKNGLLWMTPAKANNTEAIAVTKDFSEKNSVKSLADLAAYINKGGEIKFITSQLFAEKEAGLLGIEKAYGFKFQPSQLVLLPHGNTAETLKALSEGRDGINAALAYATDGSLVDLGLIVLEDPMSIPPVYEPAPIVRKETADKYPEVKEILGTLFAGLSKEKLQEMNKKVIVDGASPKDVAEAYLKEAGILD